MHIGTYAYICVDLQGDVDCDMVFMKYAFGLSGSSNIGGYWDISNEINRILTANIRYECI